MSDGGGAWQAGEVVTAWTLAEARVMIEILREKALSLGWCLALRGSVLTKGRSDHDLDLVALADGPGADMDGLAALFDEYVGPLKVVDRQAVAFGGGRTVMYEQDQESGRMLDVTYVLWPLIPSLASV